MAQHNDFGKKGEEMAVAYLRDKGYSILAENWIHKKSELDIVAQADNKLIVAEVKTRRGNLFGEPEEWVTKEKQRNLIKGAAAFIVEKNIDLEVRFDIISIIHSEKGTRINHIEDAFYPLI
jgi:putative endonuclease